MAMLDNAERRAILEDAIGKTLMAGWDLTGRGETYATFQAPGQNATLALEVDETGRVHRRQNEQPRLPQGMALPVSAGPTYTTPAVITMVLYLFLWLPGVIANIAYYSQARADRQRLGRSPDGMGCLLALLWVFVFIPIGGIVAVFLVIAVIAVLGALGVAVSR